MFGVCCQFTDQTKRDHWWVELRQELCDHARALSCPQIMGYASCAQLVSVAMLLVMLTHTAHVTPRYREAVDIHNDVCVLSVIGTAVRMSVRSSDMQLRKLPRRRGASQVRLGSLTCDSATRAHARHCRAEHAGRDVCPAPRPNVRYAALAGCFLCRAGFAVGVPSSASNGPSRSCGRASCDSAPLAVP